MGYLAAIGEEALIIGFTLAGALVYPAETPAEVRHAWHSLPDQVELVILTHAAAASLPDTSVPDATVTDTLVPDTSAPGPARSVRLVAVIPC